MPDVREFYDSITREAPAQLDPLARQRARQRRAVRNRKVGAFVLVAVIVVGIALISRMPGLGPQPVVTPDLGPLPELAPGSYRLNVRTGEATLFSEHEEGYGWTRSPNQPYRYAYVTGADGGSELMLEDLDGTGTVVRTAAGVGVPIWSPDGRYVAVAAGWDEPRGGRGPQIYVVDALTREVTRITDDEVTGGFTWAPDGTSIIYSVVRTGDMIDQLPVAPRYPVVREVDLRSEEDEITGTAAHRDLVGEFGSPADMPSISPDGNRMVFVQTTAPTLEALGRGVQANGSLMFYDLEGHTVRELVPPEPGLAEPRWSPDGRTVSFKVDGDQGWETWTVDVWTGQIDRVSLGCPVNWEDEDTVTIDVVP